MGEVVAVELRVVREDAVKMLLLGPGVPTEAAVGAIDPVVDVAVVVEVAADDRVDVRVVSEGAAYGVKEPDAGLGIQCGVDMQVAEVEGPRRAPEG